MMKTASIWPDPIDMVALAAREVPEPTERSLIAGQLETAARILRAHPSGERDDSAAWRVADAGLELRRLIERSGATDVQGVDVPTGMGALLPTGRPQP